ncbi:DUF4132 domain-containing protein [Actinomadura darangshiensis]|uniref:DUF4132 domain-containing protein n=1 Tax=Actinomadura darangshiensis TaxID=705336 RepID=A0A4V2YUH8_9ACTN|nr:DUF4132 domain-containing protein [Actinomadura darangshiensis]TDD77737.1 DUF4132 domain-containing protein [Actinomadura darangshiensis]
MATAADEDTREMPDAWRRHLHPRRDRPGPWPQARVDASAADEARALVDWARPRIEDVLALPGTTPALAEHGRAYLNGEADPLGAAVVAVVATSERNHVKYSEKDLFVDAWAAGHGVPFAACAFAWLSEIMADRRMGPEAPWIGVREAEPTDYYDGWWADEPPVRHLRSLLTAAHDDVYADAVERLARLRGTPSQKLVVSYLVPTRQDWVEEICSLQLGSLHGTALWMLPFFVGAPHQVAQLAPRLGSALADPGVVAALVDGAGPAAPVPLLTDVLDEGDIAPRFERTLLDHLAALPADEAFQALVDRAGRPLAPAAMSAASQRFPARALRLLAGAARKPKVAEPLRVHVRAHPELVEAMLPELPDGSRAAVEAIRAATVRVPDAPAEALPPLLVDPPWSRPRAKAKPVVIEDLSSPGTRSIVWEPGEQDEWMVDLHHLWRWVERLDWQIQVEKFTKGDLPGHMHPLFFVEGPDELVRPLLAGWEPPAPWDVAEWMRVVVSRFELDALDAAVFAARRDPANAGAVLLPYLSDEVARLMADWLVRLKQAGGTARTWFRRHGLTAVPALVPPALGKAGAERRGAEAALRFIAASYGAEAIVEAARIHGDKAADAIEALVSADPLGVLPAKMPVVGDWAEVRLLPQILLRDRAHALPDAAAQHVLTMLAMSKPGEVYAGVDVVRELCDRESLAEFGWALFRQWEAFGAPSKDGWALTQLGLTGDDETVRRLAPVIRAWPGDGGHNKAVTGLGVLAAIGTDVALMHLHGISQRVRFKGLKGRAQDKIAEVAAELELTAEQLADRLVPDFGLDADGGMALDYGPRRFTVGFDEQLKPYVSDENGTRRKALPKPGAKDDPDLASAAYKAFSTLKKDVRTVAADQLRRLETCMVTRRRWPLREFEELLAGHPLVRHIVRRLVWLACDGDGDGGKTTAFRVAEDGTFADADDDVLTLADSCEVGVAHPIDLDGSLGAWSEVFADYEILQPFPQLGRAVHRLADEAHDGGRLTCFEGLTVPVGKVLGLTSRGWERGAPQDAGVECWISRRLPGGRYVVIDLDPGIAVGAVDALPDQTLRAVALTKRPEQLWMGGGPTASFADLDPVTVSEILADLSPLS